MKNKYVSLSLLFLVGIILSSCENNIPEENAVESTESEKTVLPDHRQAPEQVINMTRQPAENYTNILAEPENKKENKPVRVEKVTYAQMKESEIMLQDYDPEKYSGIMVNFFNNMAKNLNGQTYFANNAESVSQTVMDVVKNKVESNTDLVLVIDKTYSMWDDIDKVRQSLGKMIEILKPWRNVKLSVALYGDKNYHGNFWYERVDLTTDYEKVQEFIDGFSILANPDIPESANDAIIRTVEETRWTPGNRRIMLVIGDAASQEPPLSTYSSADVIRKCKEMNVKFNLYPVIIATEYVNKAPEELARQDVFSAIYPNPASTDCTIEFHEEGNYAIQVFNENGSLVLSQNGSGSKINVNVSSLANGKYLFSILAKKYKTKAAAICIVRH